MSHAPHLGRRRRILGFTLIESLIAVGIAAVLSSLAYPSFEGHVLRARRVDGLSAVLAAQLAQERLRANRLTYGTLAEIGVPATSTGGNYRLAATGDARGFEITATAIGRQARDGECRHLRLRAAGAGFELASGSDAATSNPPALNRRCWNL